MSSTSAQAQALSAAFTQLRRGMLAMIRQKVRDPHLAEDLLQEVFVKAARSLQAGQAWVHLPAWLHQVMRNTVADHFRRGGPAFEALDEEPAAPEPEDEAAFQTLANCLAPLAATLPPLYRDAVMGADFQGQAHADLARAAGGVSVSAIKSRVSRGRALLRDKLQACCAVAVDGHGKVESFAPRENSACACGEQGPEATVSPRACQ